MSDPLFRVDGQVVLVSGGSRGIGRAIAAGFASRGSRVIVTGRDQLTIEKTAQEISESLDTEACHPVTGVACDVSDARQIDSIADSIAEEHGRIDTLVNVAGINKRQPAVDFSEDDFDAILDVNLKGAFFLSQAVGKRMIRQRSGSQINIGSLNTHAAMTNLLPYAISKTGLDQMTRSLAAEWGQFGIRVNTLAPGFVLTDLTRGVWAIETMEDWRIANTPQRRIGVPDDMIGTAIFLASKASEYLTGQVIYVDGGFSAGRLWPFPD